ncbi:restriction endonuclease subunit S [Citrobacter freundii]|uniref:restriction endonuclease subunit S n=1 Tax=Citrobacter freundii TaxID=546 RepID=UPI001B3766B2|nr:restriction endonuclease subunit S [Citrobacter freundii]EKU4664975.1 restriction endonuclease subunit S [Citrobacter freundii]EKX5200985.1 restriction endonuclease subunit S [Citrobacter freundii]MBQ0241975.1 restriction endonuclease subunit S [Citrobacter freundii]HBN5388374.1 restriction endonuclease subunit S [Citrobacter freundii]HBN5500779.1 restriction endonuclease subunit S [Citrobacter freundii]
MAVEKLIVDHIDTWTTARQTRSTAGRGSSGKIDLYGIKKLRELILELAVRGKLVPQDSNDEPASVLLKRITAEKAELVKQGKIKKQKPLPEISEEEKPFELPEGWEWVRLGDLGIIGSSSRVHQKDWTSKGVPFYRAREIVSLAKNGFVNNELFITDELFETLAQNGLHPEENDIMLTGVGTIGVSYIVKAFERFYFKDASVLIFKNIHKLYHEYLNFIFQSPYWFNEIYKNSMGTTVHTLTISRAVDVLIPIAPEKEQYSINAKVQMLMDLCDQLEQHSLTSLDAHQQLVETLLTTLTDSQNADELAENWARISEHFDTLFTTEASIDALKQTILQLAVMGKLVIQDPNDEPASELLKRIAQKKAQLVKDGKIKKQKPLPPISDEEKPFELPSGWVWCRISDISTVGTGATPSRDEPKYWLDGEINWVTSGETNKPFIKTTSECVTKKAIDDTNVSIYPPGTLIVAMYGQGKTRGQITELLINAGTNQACAAIQLIANEDSHRKFIKIFFEKSYDDLRALASGGAQPNLNVAKISQTVIPLPPEHEQARVVLAVNCLLNLCSSLKKHIQSAQQTQLHLADALTDAAIN